MAAKEPGAGLGLGPPDILGEGEGGGGQGGEAGEPWQWAGEGIGRQGRVSLNTFPKKC